MKKSHTLLLATLAAVGLTSVAQAQEKVQKDIVIDTKATPEVPYVINSQNTVVRSGTQLCWRTGYWTKDAALNTKVVGSDLPAGCFCEEGWDKTEAACQPKVDKVAPPAVVPPAPEKVKPTAEEKVTIPADALFDFNKAVLKPAGKEALNAFAKQTKQLKTLEVIVAVGHTDRIGSNSYNQKLSEKRALAVKEYLVGQGIDGNRIYTEGKGEAQPTAETSDKCVKMGAENGRNKKLVDCLQPDRRVELEAVGTK